MNKVQPIRDKELIAKMKAKLKKQSMRNYFLFTLGINTGLRIGDILEFKVSTFRNEDKTMKDIFKIIEQKTGKLKRFTLNDNLIKELEEYIQDMEQDEFLFQSQKGKNQHIDRTTAYRILNKVAEELGIEEIGTHTLRKTFGYFYYKATKDVAMLQELYNHSAPSITLIYIGISDEEKIQAYKGFCL